MHKGRKNSNLAEDNITAREKGLLTVREFERVAQTFKTVLLYKEDVGKSLESERDALRHKLRQNSSNLETLDRNIEIYKQNCEKVHANLDQLDKQELRIRDEYEKLLRGPRLDGVDTEQARNALDRETLLLRRDDLIENLKKKFSKLDEELLTLENLRKDLNRASEEIGAKKMEALKRKEVLEEINKKIFEDVRRVEKELDTTVQEEAILVEQFQKMVANVERCLEMDEKTDHVLFSSLTAAQTSVPNNNHNNNANNGRTRQEQD